MHTTGIYYYPSQEMDSIQYLQVTLIQSELNTLMMGYQDHSKP